MSGLPANIEITVDEAVKRLISRTSNARGLTSEILKPRILAALEKYLFKSEPNADKNAVRSFIEDIRVDDLCLIIACERGDEKAWEDLVANFDATVRSAARKMTSNSEDAEDLAGSIWAELYGLRQDATGKKKGKLAYYSGRGSLAGWLRAVVSQLAVDEYRKQSRFVQIEEDRSFENLAEDAANNSDHSQVVHTGSNPEDILIENRTSADISKALRTAITELEPEDRLILKMYYFDNLKLKDIAAAFGYHEATASRKLVRVQSEIRKSVEKQLMGVHGWSSDEVKRSLSDAAARLGISLETALGIWAALLLMQDFW